MATSNSLTDLLYSGVSETQLISLGYQGNARFRGDLLHDSRLSDSRGTHHKNRVLPGHRNGILPNSSLSRCISTDFLISSFASLIFLSASNPHTRSRYIRMAQGCCFQNHIHNHHVLSLNSISSIKNIFVDFIKKVDFCLFLINMSNNPSKQKKPCNAKQHPNLYFPE